MNRFNRMKLDKNDYLFVNVPYSNVFPQFEYVWLREQSHQRRRSDGDLVGTPKHQVDEASHKTAV